MHPKAGDPLEPGQSAQDAVMPNRCGSQSSPHPTHHDPARIEFRTLN